MGPSSCNHHNRLLCRRGGWGGGIYNSCIYVYTQKVAAGQQLRENGKEQKATHFNRFPFQDYSIVVFHTSTHLIGTLP